MALQNQDLFVVQQGGKVYSIATDDLRSAMQDSFDPTKLPIATATDLGGIRIGNNLEIDPSTGVLNVNMPATFTFKGQIAPTDNAPGSPSGGDFYLFSTGGTLNGTWGNKTGANVAINDAIVWDADNSGWDILEGLFSAGVTSVSGVAPVQITGDSANPVVSVTAATDTAAGTMSGADKAKLDSIQPNSDIGTVTEVTGNAPVQVVTGTTTPVITVSVATTANTGVTQLADATAVTNGDAGKVVVASQLKATNDNVTALDGRIVTLEGAPTTAVLGGTSISVNEAPSGTFTVNADPATKLTAGTIALASDAEVAAGTDDVKAVTPLGAASVYLIKDISKLDPLI